MDQSRESLRDRVDYLDVDLKNVEHRAALPCCAGGPALAPSANREQLTAHLKKNVE